MLNDKTTEKVRLNLMNASSPLEFKDGALYLKDGKRICGCYRETCGDYVVDGLDKGCINSDMLKAITNKLDQLNAD